MKKDYIHCCLFTIHVKDIIFCRFFAVFKIWIYCRYVVIKK